MIAIGRARYADGMRGLSTTRLRRVAVASFVAVVFAVAPHAAHAGTRESEAWRTASAMRCASVRATTESNPGCRAAW